MDVLKTALTLYWGFMSAHPYLGFIMTLFVIEMLKTILRRRPPRIPNPDPAPPQPEPEPPPPAPVVEPRVEGPTRIERLLKEDD